VSNLTVQKLSSRVLSNAVSEVVDGIIGEPVINQYKIK